MSRKPSMPTVLIHFSPSPFGSGQMPPHLRISPTCTLISTSRNQPKKRGKVKMAISSSWSFSFMLCALSIILQSVMISSSTARLALDDLAPAPSNNLINEICTATSDPNLCFEIMRSIPGASGAPSLESLAQVTITYGHSNATEILKYARSLVSTEKSPRLKANYDTCAENYDIAVDALEWAQKRLKGRDYKGVEVMATGGIDQVESCRDNFMDPPIDDPSQLPQKGSNFRMICRIIIAIVKKMM